MMNTMLLDTLDWDITIDANRNIAVASPVYATLQDVASACRLFTNELWYGGGRGIPYFEGVLGQAQPTPILKAKIVEMALSVPGVLTAQCTLTGVVERRIQGEVQITTAQGRHSVALGD